MIKDLKRDRVVKYLKPQEKYNLQLNADTNFRAATDTGWEIQLLGKYIYIIDIKTPYKYLHIPSCGFDVYLHSTEYVNLMKVPQNIFIPLDIIDKIILVRPGGLSSGFILFQYWLSDIESVKILDVYDESNFILTPNTEQNYRMPFPTYQLKVIFYAPTNPTGLTIHFLIYPFNSSQGFVLDMKTGITEFGTILNNVYEYDKICGSGAVTDPHYPFPSFETILSFTNEDLANPMNNCYLKVVSWE